MVLGMLAALLRAFRPAWPFDLRNPAMELRRSISSVRFRTLTDQDAVRLFGRALEFELGWLKDAQPTVEANESPAVGMDPDGTTPSRLLYGRDYIEVNRTLVSMLSLKWLLANDYTAFTRSQNPHTKLQPKSFERLSRLLIESCPDPDDLYALLIAIVLNDIGKNADLAKRVTSLTGQTPKDHDDVVYAAAKEKILPSLDSLDQGRQSDLMLGFEVGSQLNISQLAQAENAPACLKGASILKGRTRAFAIKFMEIFLDVAGAGGHVDARSAVQMTEPVFQTYLLAYDVVNDIIQEKVAVQEGYDRILVARGQMLARVGFRNLSASIPTDRALLRLLTMGRVTDIERARCFAQAFEDLPPQTRRSLVQALGNGATFCYAPALIAESLKANPSPTSATEILILGALMRYVARVYANNKMPPDACSGVKTIDLSLAQDLIKSREFQHDPSQLDNLEIPL